MSRILVIDDSKSVHAFLRDCLTASGVELIQAMNGQEGLDRLFEMSKSGFPSGQDSIDLILLDWEMPVMDGPGTYTEIKKRNVSIPVIMMTSRNAVDDISRMIGAGVSEYIMKPFTKDILIEKINSVVNGIIK